MAQQDETINKLIENNNKMQSMIAKISNAEVRKRLTSLFVDLSSRLLTAPLSVKTEYHGAYPGGLVQNALLVTKTMADMSKSLNLDLPVDSIIVTGLFHNLGKLGSKDTDALIEQDSQWHRDRGMMYTYNQELAFTPAHVQTLKWLNDYSVPLATEEIYAISSTQNMTQISDVDFYKAPLLAVVLQQSIRISAIKTSGKTSVLD